MYNIHPTDFLIFSFDREAFQSKVLFQRPLILTHPLRFFLCFHGFVDHCNLLGDEFQIGFQLFNLAVHFVNQVVALLG